MFPVDFTLLRGPYFRVISLLYRILIFVISFKLLFCAMKGVANGLAAILCFNVANVYSNLSLSSDFLRIEQKDGFTTGSIRFSTFSLSYLIVFSTVDCLEKLQPSSLLKRFSILLSECVGVTPVATDRFCLCVYILLCSTQLLSFSPSLTISFILVSSPSNPSIFLFNSSISSFFRANSSVTCAQCWQINLNLVSILTNLLLYCNSRYQSAFSIPIKYRIDWQQQNNKVNAMERHSNSGIFRQDASFRHRINRDEIMHLLMLKESIVQYERSGEERIRTIEQPFTGKTYEVVRAEHRAKREKIHRRIKSKQDATTLDDLQNKCKSERILKRRQAIEKNKAELLRGSTINGNIQQTAPNETERPIHKKFNSIEVRSRQSQSSNRIFRKTQTTIDSGKIKDEPNVMMARQNTEGRMKLFMEKYKSHYKMEKRQTQSDKQHQEIQNIVNKLHSQTQKVRIEQSRIQNEIVKDEKKELLAKTAIQDNQGRSSVGVKLGMKARVQLRKELQSNVILKDRYQLLQRIGKGLSGEVFKGKDILSERYVAIKILDSDPKNPKNQGEYQFYKKIQHKNIVTYYNNFIQKNRRYLILQYFPHTLHKVVKQRRFQQKQIKYIFKNIATGLLFLHSISIAHRDIKLDNIVISEDLQTIKFIDFGLCLDLNESSNQLSRQFCGTMHYMPPQILSKKQYAPKSADIWSLGILLYKLYFERYPFRGRDQRQLLERIVKTKLIFPENCSSSLRNLLQSMLIRVPSQRYSILDVIDHPWLCQ